MEPVRTGLRRLMSDLLRARPAEEAVLLAWPLVCGKEVAARTQAVSFHEGSLLVEVPDTTWRNQLAAFAPRYISSFAEIFGPLVSVLRFQIARHGAATLKDSK